MKKIKYLLIAAFSILLIAGCESNNVANTNIKEKTLTCTNSEEDSGLVMDEKVTIKFKNNKPYSIKMDLNTKVMDEEIKQYWDLFVQTLDEQYEEFEKTDGIEITKKSDDESYTYLLTLEVDVDKAKKDDLTTLNLEDITNSNSTYEDVKKEAEKDGFTCK